MSLIRTPGPRLRATRITSLRIVATLEEDGLDRDLVVEWV